MLKEFELHKIRLEIQRHGGKYSIYRGVVDEYGESTSSFEHIKDVSGLYHIEKDYIKQDVNNATTTRQKGQPKLMIEYAECDEIKIGDYAMIDDKKFIITDKNNIQFYDIVVNMSLEVVLDGEQ